MAKLEAFSVWVSSDREKLKTLKTKPAGKNPELNPKHIPMVTRRSSENGRGRSQTWLPTRKQQPEDSICFSTTGTGSEGENKGWTHPAPGFDTLVDEVGEGFPGDVPPRALRHVQVPILQHDLTLADHHQGRATALHALEDVVLQRLQPAKTVHEVNIFTLLGFN